MAMWLKKLPSVVSGRKVSNVTLACHNGRASTSEFNTIVYTKSTNSASTSKESVSLVTVSTTATTPKFRKFSRPLKTDTDMVAVSGTLLIRFIEIVSSLSFFRRNVRPASPSAFSCLNGTRYILPYIEKSSIPSHIVFATRTALTTRTKTFRPTTRTFSLKELTSTFSETLASTILTECEVSKRLITADNISTFADGGFCVVSEAAIMSPLLATDAVT